MWQTSHSVDTCCFICFTLFQQLLFLKTFWADPDPPIPTSFMGLHNHRRPLLPSSGFISYKKEIRRRVQYPCTWIHHYLLVAILKMKRFFNVIELFSCCLFSETTAYSAVKTAQNIFKKCTSKYTKLKSTAFGKLLWNHYCNQLWILSNTTFYFSLSLRSHFKCHWKYCGRDWGYKLIMCFFIYLNMWVWFVIFTQALFRFLFLSHGHYLAKYCFKRYLTCVFKKNRQKKKQLENCCWNHTVFVLSTCALSVWKALYCN